VHDRKVAIPPAVAWQWIKSASNAPYESLLEKAFCYHKAECWVSKITQKHKTDIFYSSHLTTAP
jgi:hypothetical protein